MAAGLTLGPLVSGALASAVSWPTVSPYVVDIVLASVLAGLLVRIPEPRPVTPRTVPRSRALHVPAGIGRAPFIAAAAAGAASFMVVGWVFGLSPSYLHEELHVHVTEPVVAGLFVAVVVGMNGVAELALRRYRSPGAMRVALAGVVVGMGVMASSTLVDSLPLAVAGALIAGLGTGVTQMNVMATVQHVAPAHSVCRGHVRLLHRLLSRLERARGRRRRRRRRVRARRRDLRVLRRTHRARGGGAAVDPARREPRDRHRGGADRAPRRLRSAPPDRLTPRGGRRAPGNLRHEPWQRPILSVLKVPSAQRRFGFSWEKTP